MLKNDIHYAQWAYFMINIWGGYFYFLILYNEVDIRRINCIVGLVKLLIIVQIPVIVIKFLVVGVSEKGGIGTLSTTAGSLSAIFALFIIVSLFSFYLYGRRKLYLWLIPCFILFSIIGEKRVVIIFGPIMMAVTLIFFLLKEKRLQVLTVLKYLAAGSVISFCFFYGAVRMIPSLNQDGKVGGRFDYGYARDYANRYTKLDRDHSRILYTPVSSLRETRRIDSLVYFTHYLWNKGGSDLLIGEGAGRLILMESITGEDSSMLALYGIRYGGRTAFVMAYLQVGILGVSLVFGMFLHIFLHVWRHFRAGGLHLAMLSLTVLLFVDSFTYSSTFVMDILVQFLYFGMLAMSFRVAET